MNIKKLLTFSLPVLVLPILSPVVVRAEATKEYTRDAGLYNTAPFQICTFLGATGTLNFFDNSQTDAPEGVTSVKTVTTGGSGAWGYYNTNTYGNCNFDIQQRDFSDYAGGAVRFWLKSTAATNIKIIYHNGTDITVSSTVASTANSWKEIMIPLGSGGAGFGLSAANLQTVIAPLVAEAVTNTTFYIDHFRWTKPITGMVVFPATTQVNANKKREFTVEGRNGSDVVIIYSSFTTTSGTIAPAAPTIIVASTLTASGNATVNARLAMGGSAVATVTSNNLDAAYGLLSETIPGAQFNIDSSLGVSTGTNDTILLGPSPDHREGLTSFVSTVTTGINGFAGWYIQAGIGSDASSTRDMSNFYDGSLRFWFKGTSGLDGKMKCGIRSINVDAGTELSTVILKNIYSVDGGSPFDGNWHSMVIPISVLARARPWADISRTKVLFSLFAVGNGVAGANGTFYVDNLRWDTRIPGALNSITVTPNPITIPLSAKRTFTAQGFDVNGSTVDIFPTWSTTISGGSVTPSPAAATLLTAPGTAASGNVTASYGGKNGSAAVTVAAIPVTQTYNVYSDLGAGGSIGVSTSGAAGTALFLSEINTGSIEGLKFLRSTYTLQTNGLHPFASANWFAEETNSSRFMSAYDTGYLQFYVRTNQNLQFSIRSSNITPGTENSKFTLSELGIPLDNNWQLVVVALADLKAREPNLDFTRIQTYFTITALSALTGTNTTPDQFDIDDVKWLSIKPVADGRKIYAGLRGKQNSTTGLVLSFDQDPTLRAVTYDNALAVMAFTYQKDFIQAAAILNAYKGRFDAGGFAGFHDNYKWDVPNAGTVVAPDQRTAGPNAWLLLAILHYRTAHQDHTFDAMATGIAAWLKTLQSTSDGGLTFGFIGTTAQGNRSTEHNIDAYAAFYNYGKAFNDGSYITAANNVRGWLNTKAWTGSRFLVGRTAADGANTDRALDVYSWAPLALSSYTSVLNNPTNGAEVSFSTTNINANTGLLVDGFDFSSFPGAGDVPADRDAVWLEGTGQMAMAYLVAGNISKWDYYVGQLGFAIFTTGSTTEGLTYATNPGTAYGSGFIMDATHAAASSMAWYLFARNQFNPFKPLPLNAVNIRNISDGVIASSLTWTTSVPLSVANRWVRANQYIELDAQTIVSTATANWGIQIYTDNENAAQTPRYADPTPSVTTNPDSSPAGLIENIAGKPVTSRKLDLAWRIQDANSPLPRAVQPYTTLLGSEGPESVNWFFFMDRNTPAIDEDGDGSVGGPNDGAAFQDGQVSYDIIKTANGIQVQQAGFNGTPVYVPSTNPDYIYLEANFGPAAAQTAYTTQITLEFFTQ